jgi:hypothetical protein
MRIPRRVGRVVAAVGVAGAAAAAGTIGLAAAQSTSTTTPPASTSPPSSTAPGGGPHGGPGGGPGGGFGRFGGPGIGGDVVHGEFVVPKSGGGYETLDTQTGKVTDVSSTAITVQSDDGFSKTYVVTETTVVNSQRDGIGSVAKDDTVRVTATVSGSTATAVDITDTTKVSASRGQWAPGRPARPNPPTSVPASSSTTTG